MEYLTLSSGLGGKLGEPFTALFPALPLLCLASLTHHPQRQAPQVMWPLITKAGFGRPLPAHSLDYMGGGEPGFSPSSSKQFLSGGYGGSVVEYLFVPAGWLPPSNKTLILRPHPASSKLSTGLDMITEVGCFSASRISVDPRQNSAKGIVS